MSPTVPPRIAAVRREICAQTCEAQCPAYQARTLNHDDPAAICPRRGWLHAWGTYSTAGQSAPLGLGDVVAAVAQPIARAIDAVAGTSIANCGGCTGRQEQLNAAVPDVLRPFKSAD